MPSGTGQRKVTSSSLSMPVREEDLPLMLGHFSSLLLELMQFLVPIPNTAYTPLSDFSSLNMP